MTAGSEGDVTSSVNIFKPTSSKPISSVPNITNSFPYDYFMFCFHGAEDFIIPYQILDTFVNPIMSFIGILVNTLSLAILRKSGLTKPSNIFLFALVIADSMNLFLNINFAEILRHFGPVKTKRGYCTWEYDGHFNTFLYVVHSAFIFIGNWGHLVNATIPVIITIERILAVYFPVTFKKVVTTRSSVISCMLVYTLWLTYAVFSLFFRRLAYFQLPGGNLVSMVITSELFINNFFLLYDFLSYGMETIGSWLPLSLVSVGCVLIGIKVKLSMYRRKRLSAAARDKQKWSPRTTRTLLTTCLIFAMTHAANSIISVAVPVDRNIPMVSYFATNLAEFINILCCSSNFPVYILCNRHLYQIFLQIIGRQKQLSGSEKIVMEKPD